MDRSSTLRHPEVAPSEGIVTHHRLAEQIKCDRRLSEVVNLATALYQQGLRAGSKYPEVWIRDLNSVIDFALQVVPASDIRQALLVFFDFQGGDGNIIDGYVSSKDHNPVHNCITCDARPGLLGHKNTVVTDQESSLVLAIERYINHTADWSILDESIGGVSVLDRIHYSIRFLQTQRTDNTYGLLWGATTADWGDIQPETVPGVLLDEHSHRAINIYNNALFVSALQAYAKMLGPTDPRYAEITCERLNHISRVRDHLWDSERDKFRCHIYLEEGSPFPDSFDEEAIYYHGGTAVAAQAGLMTREEVLRAYHRMRSNVESAGADSIGMIFYPPYPAGLFASKEMQPWIYGNGGDYAWWGGRVVLALIQHGLVAEAYEALSPMIDRVIRDQDFNEWYDRDGKPCGATHFRGAAGMLGVSCQKLIQYSEKWS